jgi:mercuric ion transport protein
MHPPGMTIKRTSASAATGELSAAAGLFGALAASSCCLLPLVLFSLGASGAWIGRLTALAPYQPYIFAATFASLAAGYWRVYRARSCTADGTCAAPLPSRLASTSLVLATLLTAAALGFDFVAPLLAAS